MKNGFFDSFASRVAHYGGHPITFCLAFAAVLLWAVSGPFAGFSEVWQLTINTGTTIITFLMVFIIQNTQNRDTAAMQLKLDELIRSHEGAKNSVIDFENLPEETLERLRKEYAKLAREAREEGSEACTDEEERIKESKRNKADRRAAKDAKRDGGKRAEVSRASGEASRRKVRA